MKREELINEVKSSALQRLIETGLIESSILSIWDELEDEYFLRHSDEEVMRHTQAILENIDKNDVVVNIHQYSARGATEIFIYCNDRNYLFAHITSTLVKLGLSIVHARIITSNSGHALDTFLVLDSNGQAIDDEHQCNLVAKKITEALRHPDQISTNFSHGLSRRVRELQVPIEIYFEDHKDDSNTILELKAPDFSGLLASLGNAFIDCDISVHNARISKLGERVHNIFQISNLDNSALNEKQQDSLAKKIKGNLQQPKQISLTV